MASGINEAFDNIMTGSLKLKGLGKLGKVKKKKKADKAKEVLETIEKVEEKTQQFEKKTKPDKTPAEKAFEETQQKRQKERILKKAAQTHKHRVEELNSKLGNLSEHYDIPKVSWTK